MAKAKSKLNMSPGAVQRRKWIAAGKCATCGKRKPTGGTLECKQCKDYYKGWLDKRKRAATGSGTPKRRGRPRQVSAEPQQVTASDPVAVGATDGAQLNPVGATG